MVCPQCGQPVKEGDTACQSCGCSLAGGEKQQRKSYRNLIILMVIALAGAGFWMYRDSEGYKVGAALNGGDGYKIRQLYNVSKDKDALLKRVTAETAAMAESPGSSRDKAQDIIGSLKDLNGPQFRQMKGVYYAISELDSLDREIKFAEDNISNKRLLQIDENPVRLSIYVASKIKNTDYYYAVSYETIGNAYFGYADIPNNRDACALSFKDGTEVRRGVIHVSAVQDGTTRVVDEQGFEQTLPLYIVMGPGDGRKMFNHKKMTEAKANVEKDLQKKIAAIKAAAK